MRGSTGRGDPEPAPAAVAAAGRAPHLYGAGGGAPSPLAGPPPPLQGHPGVPAAEAELPPTPCAAPLSTPFPGVARRGASVQLARNHLRGLQGPPLRAVPLARFSSSPGSREKGIRVAVGVGTGRRWVGTAGAAWRCFAQDQAASAGATGSALATWLFRGREGRQKVIAQSYSLSWRGQGCLFKFF